ncbi:MAG: hypothetical protein GKR89_10540 [Candidatus Latescibacteria bacterium]|nr:hypothetical protein [Candidatus Latescibacterota bacterium]
MQTLIAKHTVEILLAKTFRAPVEITRTERIAPWFVVRCFTASPSAAVPPSVVVKTLRDGPRSQPEQLLTEQAALEFVAELGPDLAPRLLASHIQAGLLVLEDVAPRRPLAEIVLDDNADEAAAGLIDFARALGTLNAHSSGRQDAYYTRRRALGPVDPLADRQWRWHPSKLHHALSSFQALGMAPSTQAKTELDQALAELLEPGPFLAFSNGDPGENNYLLHRGDGRLIDFEEAGYHHALIDATSLYVPWTIWVTASDPFANGLETAYRSALTTAVPEAADDRRFGLGIAAACLVYALVVRMRLERLDQQPAGDHSRLQMVSTLEAAARAAEHHRSLPHLSGWARKIAATLRRRWPDADVDLGAYRDFTLRIRD